MLLRTRMPALALAIQLTALLCARGLSADEPVSAERRVPRDTVAFFSVRNVAELRTQWALTLLGKLGQDDAVSDLRTAIGAQLEEASRRIEEHLGLGLADLLNIPQGELAVAVSADQNSKLAVVVLLDFGRKEEPVR